MDDKKIFVSYSHKDKYFAELLTIKLEEKKIAVWQDTISLKAGENWRKSIDLGIAGALAMVVALSKSSCESHYVTYEWARAMGLGKPIIPVLLENCESHPKLEPIQYIDFRNHNASTWESLIQKIEEVEVSAQYLDLPAKSLGLASYVLSDIQKDQVAKIEGYLNRKGYRMVSFERIRSDILPNTKEHELRDLVNIVPYFDTALLKGKKDGLKIL